MHDTHRNPFGQWPASLAIALLGVCLLLPAVAQAYGGGNGSRGATDRPENNRVFDDETPNVPSVHPVRSPAFPHPPFVIKPHSAWVKYGPTTIKIMRVIDFGGIPAGIVLFVFAGPEYVTYHTIKYGIAATRAGSFAIDKEKQKKAWALLNWLKKKNREYGTSYTSRTGGYTRNTGGLGFSPPASK